MLISLKWLSEYVAIPKDLQAFCDRLDLTGTGVEGVETKGEAYENIVTGQIVEKEAHPDSDHMWVCKVNVGEKNVDEDGNPEPLQIVCGAQNFEADDHVVVALIGAELPGGVKIKKSKLRGIESCGMNCSEKELGLGSDHDGIMILPEDAPIGVDFAAYLDDTDTILDLEITPNRPDCLSMVGMAREVGAIYRNPYVNPLEEEAASMETVHEGRAIDSTVSVTIVEPKRCPRYTARIIRNVKVGPSPDWLVERLASIGQRSINNVVDVTNYILYLYGQPLHAFDLNKVKNRHGYANIIVRAADDGEVFTTLDGQERTLTSDMTVIATPELGTIALAGVMGGLDTEVTDDTTDILLEAATFEPGRTSRTSRNLGLFSESSLRYERGVDDHDINLRSAAACALMVEVAGGEIPHAMTNNDGIVDVWPLKSAMPQLMFRIKRFCNMMGAKIPKDVIIEILR
ncbi:MAG: phenylalanine--tRNA ligase subunit beta, partial [Eggerthellaceae bacterium]|nr:phenylalanine--tRNA ligase subunit beta [Eggerthellaceae bacterium]